MFSTGPLRQTRTTLPEQFLGCGGATTEESSDAADEGTSSASPSQPAVSGQLSHPPRSPPALHAVCTTIVRCFLQHWTHSHHQLSV